jgi:hypothetical protein
MLYTPILARASISESSTLSSFVKKLAGKHFWYYGLLNTAHYTILATPYRSESSTLTLCHKYSCRTYGQLCSRCTEQTPTGSHQGVANPNPMSAKLHRFATNKDVRDSFALGLEADRHEESVVSKLERKKLAKVRTTI